MRDEQRHALLRLMDERGMSAETAARAAAIGAVPGLPPFELSDEEVAALERDAQAAQAGDLSVSALEAVARNTVALLAGEVRDLRQSQDRGRTYDLERLRAVVVAIRELTILAPLIRGAGAMLDSKAGNSAGPRSPEPQPRRFARASAQPDLGSAIDSLTQLRQLLESSPDPDAWQRG